MPPGSAGTAEGRYRPIRAVVHLLVTVIKEGRGLSSMRGVPAGSPYRRLPA
ncbi:hypothetical protein GCM10010182_73500 [Actinomadura cremea]|nr:hypothetical protein GCM10010182_73500 [Actinomadura cremea]